LKNDYFVLADGILGLKNMDVKEILESIQDYFIEIWDLQTQD